MNHIEYTYSVIRYRHDPSAGEMLNIGVVAYSPQVGQIGLKYEPRYSRLSEAFAGFDGDQYRRALERFQAGLEAIATRLTNNLFELEERETFADVTAVARAVWQDQGLSYQLGPALSGMTDNLDSETDDLFKRFYLSQCEHEERRQRRDDKELWDEFKKVLTPRGITKALQPVTLGANEVEFQYAYRNEKWHVIEPISLDYVDPSDISKRAYRTLGEAFALRGEEALGTYYVLLGRPFGEAGQRRYAQAVKLLADMPVSHRIVEDGEAEAFAAQLERDMRAHGLLPASDAPTQYVN